MATTSTNALSEDNSPYAFQPPSITSLPIADTAATFPVRRVYCVGKNYAAHVVEMGGDVERSQPVFFTKPSFGGVVYAGPSETIDDTSVSTPIRYPSSTDNLHYEVELVVAMGADPELSSDDEDFVRLDKILRSIYGYTVGIDLTRRDLQGDAKSKGLPWDTGKYFGTYLKKKERNRLIW